MGILDFILRRKPPPAANGQGTARAAIAAHPVKEPKGTKALVEAIEKDTQFLLGKLVIKSLVCSAKVSIECDDAYRKYADDLTQLWYKVLPDAFECFGYGRVVFEKRYGDYEGGIRPIAGLDPLPFEDTKMILDDSGNWTDVEIKTPTETLTLPSTCFWWCALDATPKNPHGKSRYLGAPLKVWKWRQQSDKNWETFEKKHALGWGVGRAPSEYPDNVNRKGDIGEIGPNGQIANPADDMIKMLDALRSGGVAVLPSGNNPDGTPAWEFNPPVSNINASPLENRRRILDAMALRSLGVPERAVTQDEATGSYGMAEVHKEVLSYTCEEILNQILTSFQEGVIDPWCEANGLPRMWLVSQPIVDKAKSLVVDVVRAVLTGQPSPLVTEGVVDFAKLLEITNLPAGEDIDGKLAKIAKQAAQLPVPSFGQPPFQGSFRRLAIDNPPVNETWEDIANKAIQETVELSKQIKELPQTGEAGRLLRRDT